MKRLIVCFFALACLTTLVAAQDYVMYETQYLTVHSGKWADFAEKMAAHNRQFHSSGPYAAQVWRVVNGPYSGQLVWAMGPCTFTDLDQRPSGDPHDPDWVNNVVSSVDVGLGEYWRLNPGLSYVPDTEAHRIIRVRFVDVKAGEGYRFRTLRRNIKEVAEKKNYPNRINVYRNRFWTASGREWAIVTAYDNWADLDQQRSFSQFVQDYEEVHGPGSWRRFQQEAEEVIMSNDDEFRELMPELGGASGSNN